MIDGLALVANYLLTPLFDFLYTFPVTVFILCCVVCAPTGLV